MVVIGIVIGIEENRAQDCALPLLLRQARKNEGTGGTGHPDAVDVDPTPDPDVILVVDLGHALDRDLVLYHVLEEESEGEEIVGEKNGGVVETTGTKTRARMSL